MRKIGICGRFEYGKKPYGGQIIKTRIFKNSLEKALGESEILTVDTYNWKENPVSLIIKCVKLMNKCENIIIMPAQNGLKVFLPLFVYLNYIFRRKIHYVVIGGWLPKYLTRNKFLLNLVKRLNGIYVETKRMLKDLNELGISNLYYLPNFKELEILDEKDLVLPKETPYKLCTFSRVMKEKGIEDAINAVTEINQHFNKIVYTLDIYGPIDDKYQETFSKIMENADNYIRYVGTIPYDESVQTLKNYYLLLFPTYYEGEGFPGTILDSLASGVPVIATNWRYNSEIINNEVEGFIYETHNFDKLKEILMFALNHPEKIINMKYNCLKRYSSFTPDRIINGFLNYIK